MQENRMIGKQIVKYGIVGLISTIIHISIAFLLVYFIDESAFYSNVLGFICAFLFSYLSHSKFVFYSNLSLDKVSKFFLVQFISLLLAIAFANLAEGLNPYLKVLFVALILPLIAFMVHKVWTFAEHEKSRRTPKPSWIKR
ncbi:MAG: hypothetical protein BA867_11735 [Desulfobacterales bacterium S5133MH16]|nr:MAG: hypothetical protein BA867_11735 [Desulfobacterales bacterium S5133MH16]OEU82544.1 MAG: hypothetical protein BA873_07945 [Desulfobulbaceae bacterium C00003063]